MLVQISAIRWVVFLYEIETNLLKQRENITHGKSFGQHGHLILATFESSLYDIITLYVPLCSSLCSASHNDHPTRHPRRSYSLHIRQAHCYIARLGNISDPREGRVLQLVRARCFSIKCVPIEQAGQGYNALSRGLHGPTFRSRSQTLVSLQ